MADGTSKPIKDVKLGDMVMAADPIVGKQAPRRVIDLIRHSGPHTMVTVWLADTAVVDRGIGGITAGRGCAGGCGGRPPQS
jgi:hypothetical protein